MKLGLNWVKEKRDSAKHALKEALPGGSGKDSSFGDGEKYDTGVSPDIAVNAKGVVVDIHESEAKSVLWYHLGKVDGGKITWGGSVELGDGASASIDLNDDGVVVEVHQSQSASTLWYRMGQVTGDHIEWGNSVQYDDGVNPSVAISNNSTIVEVHQSQGTTTLWYRVGKVDGDQIRWAGASVEYDNGELPSVAVARGLQVMEVHQSEGAKSDLWYHVGTVEGDRITFGDAIKYDVGARPSVALTDDGLAVEVHQSQAPNDTLWYRGVGRVAGRTVAWTDAQSKNFGKGQSPTVSCNGKVALEAHVAGFRGERGPHDMHASVQTLPASGDWTDEHGKNSYCFCVYDGADDKKQRSSSHTMTVDKGAPAFYAVMTKNEDTLDFPAGAVLTVTGPDGTRYDRDADDDDHLVIMSGPSVRCLVVRNPKPGDWTMTVDAPPGVRFHCECSTVPSKDVHDTMTSTKPEKRAVFLAGAIVVGLVAALLAWPSGRNAAAVTGLTGAMGLGLRPETAAWIHGFLWSGTPKDASPKAMAPYLEFVTNIGNDLNEVVEGVKTSGWGALRKYIGGAFTKQEYDVVVKEKLPVDQVVFVYALVLFDTGYITDGDKQNALRHTVWQCYLKKAFGADAATQLGEAHEVGMVGSAADTRADEINNVNGQKLADRVKQPYLCFSAAREMWDKGELQSVDALVKAGWSNQIPG